MSESRHLFAERFRVERARSQLSQSQLADAIGVSQNQVARMENGTSEAKVSQIAVLCKLWSVSSDYLIGVSDFRTPHGLAPDDFIVDLDKEVGPHWCAKVPRRFSVLPYEEMVRLRDGKGEGGDNHG